MPINFNSGLFIRQGITNIAGPQFEQEATTLKLATYTFTTTGNEAVYTVTTGKTFYINKIMMINVDSSNNYTWVLLPDNTEIYRGAVNAKSTVEVDLPIPIALTSAQIFLANSGDVGSKIALIGWEV